MGRTDGQGQGRKLAATAGLAAGATLAMGGVANAACTCNVDSLLDPTDGGHTTLRDAITNANANAGPDTISFASGLTGTINLASDLPTITEALAINGPGAGQITVSGQNLHRIFDVKPATDGAPVSISGLTIANGNPDSSATNPMRGAGILNENAHLTVSNSVITGNHATSYTGGISSGCGTQCGAATNGPGYAADLTVTNSTLTGNTSGAGGGAIYFNYGSGKIANSTISGNTASWGGGVGVYRMQGPTVIENSTISGNTVTGGGGGVYVFKNPAGVTLSSSTVSGNSAANGGGVYDYNSTGGMAPPGQNPVLHNTIVAGNTGTTAGPDVFTKNGSTFDSAFSLIQDPSGATINETVPGSDVTGKDPQLAPLASNGGATQTMLPAATSPAIDQGSAFGLTTDQRGLTRPIELPGIPNSAAAGADGSDIGAVELQPGPSAAAPSNVFTHGKPKLNKKKGTATITVTVPGPGTLKLTGKNLVTQRPWRRLFARRARTVTAAGTVKLTIKSKGKARKKLNKKGKVKVKPTITFTPTGGSAASQLLHLTLKKTKKK